MAKIPRHIRQNAITEGDLECILTRNCEGTEQLRKIRELPSDPLNNLTIKKNLRGEGAHSCEGRSPLAHPTWPRKASACVGYFIGKITWWNCIFFKQNSHISCTQTPQIMLQ